MSCLSHLTTLTLLELGSNRIRAIEDIAPLTQVGTGHVAGPLRGVWGSRQGFVTDNAVMYSSSMPGAKSDAGGHGACGTWQGPDAAFRRPGVVMPGPGVG